MQKLFTLLVVVIFLLSSCQQKDLNDNRMEDKQRSLANDEEIVDIPSVQIPFQEFKDRWNAISDEMTYENYIHHYEMKNENNESFAIATIDYDSTIKISHKNQFVSMIQITTQKSSDENKKYSMLSSWMQLLLLTNPQIQMSDIDEIFSNLQIGANASIESLTTQSFTFGQVQYNVKVLDYAYVFEAVMPSHEVN